jgi:predicted MarR family transcription regulator
VTHLMIYALRKLVARGDVGGTAARLDVSANTLVALVHRRYASRKCFDGVRDIYYVTPEGREATRRWEKIK